MRTLPENQLARDVQSSKDTLDRQHASTAHPKFIAELARLPWKELATALKASIADRCEAARSMLEHKRHELEADNPKTDNSRLVINCDGELELDIDVSKDDKFGQEARKRIIAQEMVQLEQLSNLALFPIDSPDLQLVFGQIDDMEKISPSTPGTAQLS